MLRLLTLGFIAATFISCSEMKESSVLKPQNENKALTGGDFLADPLFKEVETNLHKQPLLDDVTLIAVNKSRGVINNGSLFLKIYDGESPAGIYSGSAQGSKVIVGFEAFNQVKLNTFESIEFDSNVISSGEARNLQLSLLVDLKCDGTTPDLQILNYDLLVKHHDSVDTFISYKIRADDLVDFMNVVTNNPNACFINSVVTDNEMPMNVTLAGIMLELGESNTTTSSKLLLDNIKITINKTVTNINFN